MQKPKLDSGEQQPSVEKNARTRRSAVMMYALVTLSCVVVAGVAFNVGRRTTVVPVADQPREVVKQPEAPIVNQPPADAQNENMPTPAEQEALLRDQRWHVADIKDFTLLNASFPSGLVEWQVPKPQPDFGGFSANVPGSPPSDAMQHPADPGSPFLVGAIKKGAYAGYGLYVSEFECEGPCSLFARFLSDGKTVVLLPNYSDAGAADAIAQYVKNAGKYGFKTDGNFDIPELDFPKTVALTTPKVTVKLAPDGAYRFSEFFSPKPTDKPEFAFPGYGSAYRRDNEGSFVIQAPDGSPQRYYIDLEYLYGKGSVPQITWNGGKKNATAYQYQSLGGCGFSNYANVVSIDENALVIGGNTAGGEPIYVLKDPKDPIYSAYYENVYYAPDGQKMSFDDFVTARPFFYWKDIFGRLIQFTNVNFQTQAECGKPVIYLYPTKTTDVSVRVEPTGGMTKSDPAYGSGWEVTAQPDGQLVQKGTGTPYPYLFWEGRSDSIWQMPDRGFVVAQADVSRFLDAKLVALGLNAKETADFKEFWVPRFQGHPYYFVTFMGNAVMDRIAPLIVSPRPDTVIRVLMDFKGLEKPIVVQPQTLEARDRKGFTVIEWGGVIH